MMFEISDTSLLFNINFLLVTHIRREGPIPDDYTNPWTMNWDVVIIILVVRVHNAMIPANMTRWYNVVGLLLSQRLERSANSKPTLGQRLVLARLSVWYYAPILEKPLTFVI